MQCSKDRAYPKGSFRSYLFAIAMNQLRMYYRKRTKRARESDDYIEACVGELLPASAATILSRKREIQLVVQALRRIPLKYKISSN